MSKNDSGAHLRWRENLLEQLRKHQAQAAAHRAELLERLKARQSKTRPAFAIRKPAVDAASPPTPTLNVDAMPPGEIVLTRTPRLLISEATLRDK